jgi:hypothetical protein
VLAWVGLDGGEAAMAFATLALLAAVTFGPA